MEKTREEILATIDSLGFIWTNSLSEPHLNEIANLHHEGKIINATELDLPIDDGHKCFTLAGNPYHLRIDVRNSHLNWITSDKLKKVC
jgi:hypothetical protein